MTVPTALSQLCRLLLTLVHETAVVLGFRTSQTRRCSTIFCFTVAFNYSSQQDYAAARRYIDLSCRLRPPLKYRGNSEIHPTITTDTEAGTTP